MLAYWLERSSQVYGETVAIAHGLQPYMTYRDLGERAARFAAGLISEGEAKKGDRIAIFASNCPEYLEILFGIWHAGMVAVPINGKLHPREVNDILEDSAARLCLISDDLTRKWQIGHPAGCSFVTIGTSQYEDFFAATPLLRQEVKGHDLAWLFYTSGTTGKPKGAMLSYDNLVAMCHGYVTDVNEIKQGHSIIHAAPMSHGSGLYALPHIAAGAINVIPESGGFDPQEIELLYSKWKQAAMFAAPTMVRRMVAANLSPDGLKNITYGGGPMYLEDAKQARAAFPGRLSQIYGQGESPMTITVLPTSYIEDNQHPDWEKRLASVGLSNLMTELRIVNEDGHPLAPCETGEIIVKGPSVMLGYWNNPEATDKTIKDGWLYTGDMGQIDHDGFLTLMDRSKDVIISGGSNIYPREIEEVLLRHPKIVEVSVIARNDPEWGEIPIAYLTGQAPVSELEKICLDNMARFKRPKEFIFLAELPKNNYGKILKTKLRELDQSANV